MSDPRPNELAGQVAPNTLSGPGRRPPPTAPAANAPRATGIGMPKVAAPSAPPRATRVGRRPISLWTLIVLGFIVINLVRGFIAASEGSQPIPTTEPAASISVPVGGGSNIDPGVSAGPVDFGTGVGSDCNVTGAGTSFPTGTPVWWYAHLGTSLPGDAQVVFTVTQGGTVLHRETGPDEVSDEEWNGLCAGEPVRYFGVGTYRIDVWDSAEKVLLSTGEYRLVPGTPLPTS